MMIAGDRFSEDRIPLSEARKRLAEPKGAESAFRMVMAAALLAASACCLAMAVILGPFWQINNPQLSPASLQSASVHQSRSSVAAPATSQPAAIVAAPPSRGHA
ncbi:MAG: hypothetical protein ACYDD1_08410 [Caulobacteraceae bacterium]